MSNFPSTLSSLTDPNATDRLNSPSHSSVESAQNDGIEKLEAFIGTLSSVSGTLMYDVRAAASDGGGHVQTANKGGTGQTSYAKGDLLVAQSSSVLSKLTIGSNNQILVADSTQNTGVKWGAASIPTVSSFVGTGTWTKPSVLSYAVIEVVGGGGGGGGAKSTGNTATAGGGAGGGYAREIIIASLLGTTEDVTIGAGGGGGAGATPAAGSTGGTTVFGASSLLSATGGGGGDPAENAGASGNGGAGGTGSGGQLNTVGNDGGRGSGTNGSPGADGGSSHYGGGGKGSKHNTGGNGRVYGGGAGGASADSGSGSQNGGTGAAGITIVTEYYI